MVIKLGGRKMVKKYINAFKSKPILTALISSFIIGVIGTGIWMLDFKLISNSINLYGIPGILGIMSSVLMIGSLVSIFLVFPVLLSIINLIYLFNLKKMS